MYIIYIDGGSKNNQVAFHRHGYGSLLVTKEEYPNHERAKIGFQTFDFGKASNNQAEYRILQEALLYCIDQFIPNPTIYTDSDLLIKQLEGTYKTKDTELQKLKDAIEKDIKLVGAIVKKAPRDTIYGVLGH